MSTIQYPPTRKSDQVDEYHGTPVPDPYRWLEETDSPETRAWIEAQNALTFDFLENIPFRDEIRNRITELWDFPKASAPVHRGVHYFQFQNSGLQNQDVLYVRGGLDGESRVLLDPNTLSEDGTVALTAWSVSKDGRWLAYATSASGSDWQTWRVREVETGEDLPDEIEWSKFSEAAWRPDQSGFYYSRYAAPEAGKDLTGTNYYQKVYFHRIGTGQNEDVLVYERPDEKEWGFAPEVTDDGKYLIFFVWAGTDRRNRVFYQDLHTGDAVVELIPDLEAAYEFIGSDGPVFYFRTDLDAPQSRIAAIDVGNPGRQNWRTVVPEQADALETVRLVNNEFICLYMKDAHHRILRFGMDGSYIGEIDLPALGSVSASGSMLNLAGRREDAELFYGFWSFLYPQTIFRFDFKTEKSETIFTPAVDFNPEDYLTRQVFVLSRDGTRVPMFLTHRRGLQANGENRVLLYGYGGFNVPLLPSFYGNRIAWLERGGVYASANLRGGGEYGAAWHKAGSLHEKQNVFDDFIACAEWLVESGITEPSRLGIVGGSNGGLLVGACMTQRPDLFGACVPQVGVMDMLRFHHFTIGWAWVSDYGSADDPEQFRTLFAYSPLHTLKPGTAYPATLVTTADHDDRVVPGHSFKFAAALQAAQTGNAPVLIRIQTKAGHGMGKPTRMVIQELADIYAFLEAVLE